MRLNLEWLRESVGFDLEAERLAEQLTIGGLEVDSVQPAAGDFSGVVVGEVAEVRAHPNADRLRLCSVSDGRSAHSVVCGAPNVSEGMKTVSRPSAPSCPGAEQSNQWR